MRIYRTCKRARLINDYVGSLVTPGRWNPEGTPILYSSCALSLSILEQMVHIKPPKAPPQLIWAYADIDESLHPIHTLDESGDIHDVAYTHRVGKQWVNSVSGLAMRVPSAVLPPDTEFNVLLNPLHPGYAELRWSSAQPFPWDQRILELIRKAPAPP